MSPNRGVVLLFWCSLLGQTLCKSAINCPTECICEQIDDDDSSVVCTNGGIDNDKLQTILSSMPLDVAKLTIEGQPTNPNKFSLPGDISRFKNLKQLHLVNCAVPSIGKRVFAGMAELRTLNMRDNLIDYVSMPSFYGLENLETLDLSHNSLGKQRLPTGAFNSLHGLKRLSLAHNNITHFSANLFSGLGNLEGLLLDGNRPAPEDVSALFSDVPKLTTLEMNHCKLKTLEDIEFQKASGIRKLGLGWNDLSVVQTIALKSLINLTEMDMSGNGLTTIPDCAFCGFKIRSLSLAHNNLGDCYTANVTNNGEGLQLDSFKSLPLTELDLSFNGFHTFDAKHVLGHAHGTIRILHLSGNPFTEIAPEMTRGLQLSSLHLANTNIAKLPPRLPSEFENLSFLNLSGNVLNDMPDGALKQLVSLKALDLSYNHFRSLTSDRAVDLIRRLNIVYLNDNPWDCRCHMAAIRDYLMQPGNQRRSKSLKYERVRCKTPSAVSGQTVVSLNRKLDCAVLFGANYGLSQASEFGILLGAVLTAVILAALVIALICWAREQKQKGTYQTREDSTCHLNPNNLLDVTPPNGTMTPYSPTNTTLSSSLHSPIPVCERLF